jgi:hypothetical protein
MYRQFCKNLKNFLSINESDEYRFKIAKEIEVLADIEAYNKHKEKEDIKYEKITNFIFSISKFQDKYPSLKNFIWELWGYGFDIEKIGDIEIEESEDLVEKVKLIDLLLGTHYWA